MALPIDHAFPAPPTSVATSHVANYETDCAGGPHCYGKGTTSLEGPLQSPPYHYGVLSQRCCPVEYMPPSHYGLMEVDATFHRTIVHYAENLRAGI